MWSVPATFLGFLEMVEVRPHPFQRVFIKVAYDGMNPCELEGEEREMAHRLFDRVDPDGAVHVVERYAPFQRRKVWSMMGGRAGKSYLFGALRLVWGAYVRDLSSLAPGQKAVALCCAPNDGLRQEIINYQLGVVRSHPDLRATIIGPKTAFDDDAHPESFVIRRPNDGELVTFSGATANRGGYGGRGRSLTDFLGDEAAFFLGEKSVVNDKEIFKGASPRVLPGGQCIGQTTAFAKLGYHYEQWKSNYGSPVTAIAAKATTEQLRPDASPMVAAERLTDPVNARREFDADPMGDAAFLFFGTELVESCIRDVPWFGTTAHAQNPQVEKAAGGDCGFRSNSSSLAISYRVLGVLVLGFLLENRPENGMALKPSLVIGGFRARMLEHGVTYLTADGHYAEAVREHLDGLPMQYALKPDDNGEPVSASPGEVAMRAKKLMQEGRVTIPNPANLPPEFKEPVERLIQQLKEVRGQAAPGGRTTIHMPLWNDGSHGDNAVAFLLSLWSLYGESPDAPPPAEGTDEWERAELARYQEELRQELESGRFR